MEQNHAEEALADLDLPPALKQRIAEWLSPPYDGATVQEVSRLILEGDTTTLTDAFIKTRLWYRWLTGCAGRNNRMNRYGRTPWD